MTDVRPIYPTETAQRRFLQGEIIRLFETSRVYCEHLDSVRSSALTELQAEIDALSDQDRDDDDKFLSLDYQKREDIEELFDKLQWPSALIICCAQFEVLLGKICRSAHHPTELNLTDIQGKGIQQAKLFVEKVCHVDLTPAADDWTAVRLLTDLRNHLVHGDEYFDPIKKTNLARLAEALPGISQAEYRAIPALGAVRKIRLRPSKETLVFCIDVFQRSACFVLKAVAV